MALSPRIAFVVLIALTSIGSRSVAQTARISEQARVITTYPFSEPNPIPILTSDTRLYPYHSFEGYAHDGVPQEWNVVHMENDFIEVFVLPEAGGKVWGAIVKRTGHEFIYRNEVMKFRNIALRGPWTSGGIEFNFGVIGHTPSTATPVDYVLRENPDGSVSCIVGAMDLPSRTHWRVEIRLPPDRAYFETNVLWYNPTTLEQPYYNWMTAAAFARNDLEMSIPGNAFLEHSGMRRDWPVDSIGRSLPTYANNTFAGHKSYHVVGELNDFFGGYYRDDEYGFGHWSRHEEMPGQKLWLWALSREGGVWEDLLTDTDGQYVEYQAGRLLVQYSPGNDVNPISQVGFDPGAADRWSETWFPLEGIGGLTDASRDGAMHVQHENGRLTVNAHAFGDMEDTLRISSGDRSIAIFPIAFSALEPVARTVDLADDGVFRIELPALGLDYISDASTRAIAKPFVTDGSVREQIPEADQWVAQGRELVKGRRYAAAHVMFTQALTDEPWHRDALLGLADLEYRRGRYEGGLAHVSRALQLDAYDATTNFIAGNLYRALDRGTDARDAYGWAARSMMYRSAAYVQLAELALADGSDLEAARYARLALDYDRYSLPARQVLAMVGRQRGNQDLVASMRAQLLEIDALHHFATAEAYLAAPDPTSSQALTATLKSEFPDQTILELAIDYARRGSTTDAVALLRFGAAVSSNPLLRTWHGWLDDDPTVLAGGADPTLVFPFRTETLPVLRWAAQHGDHWSWTYLLSLNLWALDREDEASVHLTALGDTPDFAPVYVARALLLARIAGRDPEIDLRRAVLVDGTNRTVRIHLVRHLQDRGRWEDALTESSSGRTLFPGDFNLDLLHVRSLNELGRSGEAIDILNATHVLPSENARTSHKLYEQAHTIAALDHMEGGAYADAQRHLRAALDWPERLGQGRPYDPEERLVRYLLGLTAQQLGQQNEANSAFEAVTAATDLTRTTPQRLDVLAIRSLVALGRTDAVSALAFDASPLGPFDDLDGRLLLRALAIEP